MYWQMDILSDRALRAGNRRHTFVTFPQFQPAAAASTEEEEAWKAQTHTHTLAVFRKQARCSRAGHVKRIRLRQV